MTDQQGPTRPQRFRAYLRKHQRAVFSLLAAFAILATLFATRASSTDPIETVPLSELLGKADQVTEAKMADSERSVTVTLDDGTELRAVFPIEMGPVVYETLVDAGAEVSAAAPVSTPLWQSVLISLLPFLLIGLMLWYFMRGRVGSMSKLGGNRGKSVEVPPTRLSDVAGMPEVVEELAEVASLLTKPDHYSATGARTPNGFLLEGPPGTGKTLLARAIAGEAGVPFFALAGSDFVEMYAGLGAARVRSLFAQARKSGAAVIFIDEIDAIGRRRSHSSNPADGERESTLNALLVEMDGFEGSSIVVIAATNRADLLDSALTRPGRFDRTITVPLPDRASRAAILSLHARSKPVGEDVDFDRLSRRTSGMSGADLENLLNQAALLAARSGGEVINSDHVEEALATVVMGRARAGASVTDLDRTVTAWHEAGHTIAAFHQEHNPDPVTVTIIPRGPAGGVTWMDGMEDVFFTRAQCQARLVTSMAGRAAEEILMDGDYTQGAHGDFTNATHLARNMVVAYGMSNLGPAVRENPTGAEADAVAAEIDRLLDDALQQARALLTTHREDLRVIAEALLVEETLTGEQVRDLVQARAAQASQDPDCAHESTTTWRGMDVCDDCAAKVA